MKGGAREALNVVDRSGAPPLLCGVGAAYLDDTLAAAARTRCAEEFSTGSVCTVGLP